MTRITALSCLCQIELYASPSVEVLKLMSDFLLKVPAGGTCFPNVKILTMQLESPDNILTEKLFCSCPSLEELSIQAYLNDEGPTTKFVISSSTLKQYTLWVATEGEMFTQTEYKVRITAPSLERLHIMSDIFGKFVVHDLNSLTDVILDIVYGEWSRVYPNRSIQLLQQLNNTTSLTISYGVLCVSIVVLFMRFDENIFQSHGFVIKLPVITTT